MERAEETVRSFCAALSRRDPEELAHCFSDDAVYHNVPLEPSNGRDAIRLALAEQCEMFAAIEFRVLQIAAVGTTVLTERLDVVRLGDHVAEIPVMGVFETAGDCITAWRDYFDVAQVGRLLAPADDAVGSSA